MRKDEFLNAIRSKLSKNKADDIDERVKFYGEMLDDLLEEGTPEEEATEKIYASIDFNGERSEAVPEGNGEKKVKLKTYQKALFWVTTPILLVLLIALFAVLLALLITFWALIGVLWALIGTLWAVFGAMVLSGVLGIPLGIFTLFINAPAGLALLGSGFVCSGLSVLSFFGCKAATRAAAKFTKWSTGFFSINVTKKENG